MKQLPRSSKAIVLYLKLVSQINPKARRTNVLPICETHKFNNQRELHLFRGLRGSVNISDKLPNDLTFEPSQTFKRLLRWGLRASVHKFKEVYRVNVIYL
ncbi:MAG: hypothetical protein ACTS41_01605 [Candidatus Hodgkinia cicadicola]